MRSQLLEIISECDGLDHYTETHANASLDRLAADLRKFDNADRVFAMNLSNRISNRDREAARRLVAMSRTPPKQNPHDPYEAAGYTDALCDPPLVGGGQGRDAMDVAETGNAIVGLFWGVMFSGAIVMAALFGKGCF